MPMKFELPDRYAAPKRHLLVTLAMRCTSRTKLGGESVTPHCHGGTDLSKVEWEYGMAPRFLEVLPPFFDPRLLRGRRLLDAGCGWGGKAVFFAEHLQPKSVDGFDLPGFRPEIPLEFAAKRGVTNCRFTNGFAEEMPYADGQFDVVILEDVLEHVRDPERTIRECFRVLSRPGTVLIKFPSFKSIGGHHLNRAMQFPALHYLLPISTWASGLNYLLIESQGRLRYSPFDAIVATRYSPAITANLNGLHYSAFREIVGTSGFRTSALALIPVTGISRAKWLTVPVYRLLFRVGVFKEFLSNSILYVGVKDAP